MDDTEVNLAVVPDVVVLGVITLVLAHLAYELMLKPMGVEVGND